VELLELVLLELVLRELVHRELVLHEELELHEPPAPTVKLSDRTRLFDLH